MSGYPITGDYHVERPDASGEMQEIILEVRARVWFGSEGSGFNCLPENSYPPEGDEIDIEGILLNGKIWDGQLTEKETEEAEQILLTEARDAAYWDRVDQYDDMYDDYYDDDYDNEEDPAYSKEDW